MKRNCMTCVVVAIMIIFISASALYLYHRRHWGDTHFVQKVWLAERAKKDRSNIMRRMASDLMQNYLKPGMRRSEVHALLGKPQPEMASNEYDSYFLGISPLPLFLEVHYDSAGRLTSTNYKEP